MGLQLPVIRLPCVDMYMYIGQVQVHVHVHSDKYMYDHIYHLLVQLHIIGSVHVFVGYL